MGSRALFVIGLVGTIGMGCATPSAQMKNKAVTLEAELTQYQSDQQARINSLNQQYRATYAALVADLQAAAIEQRDLQFADDSQRIADQMIAGWPKSVQPTQLHDSFGTALGAQLKRVQLSDDELAAQKAAYAVSFQALSIQLSKLEEARRSLRALATRKQVEEYLQLLVEIVQAAGEQASH